MKHNKYPQTEWLGAYARSLKKKTLKPFFVQWMATKKCNFSCGHCGTNASAQVKDELTAPQMYKVIDSLAKLGCKYLSVTGGEPFLRSDLFDILGYARKKKIQVSIVTNGFETRAYLSQIKQIGLHGVSVSIDGYKETHDLLRSKSGSYARCMDSLRIYKQMGLSLRQVSTVVLEENINDIPRIITDAFKAGCTRYRLQLLIPEGRASGKQTPAEVIKQALRIILSERKKGRNVFAADSFGFLGVLENKVRHHFFCGCGWWTLTIMPNGDIMGCPAVDHPRLNEGNVKKEKLEDIWWNGFARFRNMQPERLPYLCRNCEFLHICRGGCWAQRVSNKNFCYVKLANEI